MIDLHDPALYAAGGELAAFAELRASAEVVWHPLHDGGFWAVMSHQAATAVLSRPELFTSARGTRAGVVRPTGAGRTANNLDGEAHARLRAVVDPAFAELAPVDEPVARIAGATRDRLAAGRPVEVVGELARPLAAAVLCRWLGLGEDRAGDLIERVRESHRVGILALDSIARRAPDQKAIAGARAAKLAIGELVGAGMAQATSGAFARIAAADLSPDEATFLSALLIEAGFPTVADTIASAVATLAGHRDTDRPTAADELIRLACPVVQFARTATRATEVAGRSIAAGDQLVVYFAAANHDPAVFADPEIPDLDRRPNPHLSFGAGPHRCPGAAMARRLLRIVAATLAPVLADLSIAEAPVRRRSRYLRGYERLVVSR